MSEREHGPLHGDHVCDGCGASFTGTPGYVDEETLWACPKCMEANPYYEQCMNPVCERTGTVRLMAFGTPVGMVCQQCAAGLAHGGVA